MIKEIIVVEGRDDEQAVKRAVECDTIATGGIYFNRNLFQELRKAYEGRGLIIFTDPDYAGEKIRKTLLRSFPKAKNAYISQGLALKKGDIGVENASKEAIREALKNAKPSYQEKSNLYDRKDLILLGLNGPGSKMKREFVGNYLHIGYGNAKQFLKKLNAYHIEREKLVEAIEEYDKG